MINASFDGTRGAVYLDYFSLDCPPFSDEPDPRFFYAANALSQRLDLLTHLTQFGDSIVIVAGPEGSGKTALLDHFTQRINASWTVVRLKAAEAEDLRRALAPKLGGGDASVKQMLTDWMNRSQASDLLVVVIDDADELGQPAIGQLAALFDPAVVARTRLVLFGTPKTGNLVKQAQEEGQFRGSTQFLEMPRFSDEDTAAYLMYRLAVAGYSGESPFSPTQVSAIGKKSDGRPAEINRLADQCLTEQFEHAASRPTRHGGPVLQRILPGIAVMLALAVGAGVWHIFSRNTNNVPEILPEDALQEIDGGAPEPVPVASTGLTGETEVATPEPASPVTVAEPPAEPPAVAEAAPAAENATHAETVATTDVAPEPEPEQAPVAAPPAPVTAAKQVEAPPETATPALPAAPPPAVPSDSLAHREDWLLAQDAARYTLQLLGTRNEDAARKFIEQLALPAEKVSYYKGLYKGGDWYVVLYGSYSSRSAASADIATLPETLRAANPWPRPMKSVHEAIEAAGTR